MNILYINHYAGSEHQGMEFRPFFLAKQWIKMGFKPTIVAADFSHLRKNNPTVERDFEETDEDGVTFCWLKTTRYDGNGAKRVVTMLQFVLKLVFNAKKIAAKYKPDVIICSSTYPIDTYAGQRIAKYSKAKLIHEIHDLWPLTPMELGGYSKNHPFIKLMAQGEKSAYKKSAVIVSILPNTRPYVESLGIKTKVVNVPNGIVLENINDFLPADEAIKLKVKELKEEGYFVIGYAGGLSVSNAMLDLLRAAELMKSEKAAFIIIGSGIDKAELMAYKENSNLNNVYFYEAINKKAVHNTLCEMDALYIGSHKTKLYSYGVSANKIFDYLLTGKPIIDAFDTQHSPLDYVGTSFKAEAGSSASIKDAINRAMLKSPEELKKIEETNIRYVKEKHNYEKLAMDFAKEFI